ncbi:hypothetical protein [Aquimarina sediminis]|uniref:hypothetical protein n=1 Tax=Aquimarina sediminis TaxID=2070536 RepID=UPI000CA06B97|nr:hypothetical protein [Aquimarina sediminis]
MSRTRELCMDVEVMGRTFCFEDTVLKLVSEEEPEIIQAYFAEKKIENVDEGAGTHTYTFVSASTDTGTDVKKDNIATVILKKVNSAEKNNKKHTTQALVRAKLTEASYAKDATITIDLLKTVEKVSYPKLTSAPMGYQVYLIVETKKLKDKKGKVKIREKEEGSKLLKSKDKALPVLVFAKKEDTTTNTEASDWIEIDVKEENGKKEGGAIVLHKEDKGDKIEVGIKKIQLRPKEDKIKTESEDAVKSFEGWQEALYIREDETEEGKKAAEEAKALEETRKNETFITLTRDTDADKKENKKSFPKKVNGPAEIGILGKDAIFTVDEYGTTATTADKNNIRWCIYVDSKKTDIDAKSKSGLYTYAKTELVDVIETTAEDGTVTKTGGTNKLTIVFDKALEGKKIQIEPYRGKPDHKSTKGWVYENTVKGLKIVKRETTSLWLQTQCDSVENAGEVIDKEFKSYFKLKYSTTIYIYSDGKISKTYLEKGDKVRYVYVDSSGEEHDLGSFAIIEAQKWLDGTKHYSKTQVSGEWKKVISGGKTRYYKKDGNRKTLLMTPFSGSPNKVFKYKKGNLDFAIYEDTSREYFNPEAFSTVIGALAKVNFNDLVSNGSVSTDATGAYSVTHFNGVNMDFKYLRKDKKKGNIDNGIYRILVGDLKLDIIRQNQFLDALHDYGWGVTKKNLAHKTHEGKELNHCESDSHHKNHLHLQGFKPNYK